MFFVNIIQQTIIKEQKELYTPAGKLKDTFLGVGGGWGE